jgi:hypothetical protein
MFKSISNTGFIISLTITLIVYYTIVLKKYYRLEIQAFWRRLLKRPGPPMTLIALLLIQWASAQTADGNNGINQANTLVRGYFDTGVQLMYAIGAILGLIGAIRVFKLWTSGHREDVGGAIAGWFGSCVFLVVVATVIKSFFGL